MMDLKGTEWWDGIQKGHLPLASLQHFKGMFMSSKFCNTKQPGLS